MHCPWPLELSSLSEILRLRGQSLEGGEKIGVRAPERRKDQGEGEVLEDSLLTPLSAFPFLLEERVPGKNILLIVFV